MDKDKKKLLKSLGVLSSIGISVVLAILIGVLIGLKLDEWFGTGHLFFFIFLFIGIIAGFRNVFVIVRRETRKDSSGEDNGK
ncbi:MAG TPA: AtpZ/AtpI family protein [Geobacteraceae bacterium]|nr:AtpZ/AtpI family protein [Geobacteraceae bacterium]